MAERRFVRDLMTVGVATCAEDAPATDIARLLLDKNLEAVVVLNDEGHGVGVVSQDDLVKAYSRDGCHDLTAADIMSDDVPQVPPDIPLTAAAQIMRDRRVRALFLMHHADGVTYPAGVLTYRHLLRHLAARDDGELNDLGIKAARQAPLETFIERREAARRQSTNRE
ncbi:MAG: CBS domain-containing protein [Chloroflexi bacterium]|nr:CBS domain-containing protein [Chloroflexota bacterium]